MNTFQTLQEAANYIWHRYEKGYNYEMTVNDVLVFSALGVYAYTNEARRAGLAAKQNGRSAFTRQLTHEEVNTLLAWLLDNDGYLIAA